MSVPFDVERDNAHFMRILKRVLMGFVVLVFIFLTALTYSILSSNPSYMSDWRGITCIMLATIAFLLYATPMLFGFFWQWWDWPPPLHYGLSIWGGVYISVFLLSLINNAFLWAFYVVFATSFGLFRGRSLVSAVSIMAFTMFAFQGLLVWPISGGTLVGITSQSLTIFSMMSMNMMFQHLTEERFERNHLLLQLARANTELEEAHHRVEQSASHEQELAILRERTRLAREMHDTLGHALVLISVKLEAAQRLRERDPERCDSELESTKQIARDSMAALRASIANLRTPALEREPIAQVLGRSVRELARRTGLHITYTLHSDIASLPQPIEETLWKVSQEALTNIEKHAQAKHVEVSISRQQDNLLISIHDDGIGLPEALGQTLADGALIYNSPKEHYGLNGMRERVEAIGGHLSLRSSKEQGTTVEISLPLSSDYQLEGGIEGRTEVEQQQEVIKRSAEAFK